MSDFSHNEDVRTGEGWLRDEPATWHEMNRALQDVSILLQYVGELPDARLLDYFKEKQEDYTAFVCRLFQIAAAFQTGQIDLLPEQDASDGCSAIAFVYWSRDFLSAMAAPATAESIRITHDFLVCRAWTPWGRGRPPQASEPKIPALPPDLGAPTRNRLASNLARQVRLHELVTIAAVFVTLLVSVYALSGRLILNNEQVMRDTWSKVDSQLEAEEDKIFEPAHLPIAADARQQLEVMGLCDLTRAVPIDPEQVKVAENGATRTDASPAPSGASGPVAATRTLYATAHQAHLCADRAKALLDLFVVTAHMQSWSSAVTESFDSAFSVPFGMVPSALHAFAEDGQAGCYGLRPGSQPVASCERILWAEIDRSHHVADSILGAVTQYVLPVLYGFLGAMAAAMRLLRRKVDASLLSYTDRARLQQGAILGVLCGAVIGLFATFLGPMGGTGSVGTAALALLAGYNVDGVFRFLDELSDRLFRPGAPAKSG